MLTNGPSNENLPETIDREHVLRETVSYWQDWTARANLVGEYADTVEPSLIALKALLALMNAGYFEKACASRNWLLRAAGGSPDQVQTYGIKGEQQLIEGGELASRL